MTVYVLAHISSSSSSYAMSNEVWLPLVTSKLQPLELRTKSDSLPTSPGVAFVPPFKLIYPFEILPLANATSILSTAVWVKAQSLANNSLPLSPNGWFFDIIN